MNRRGVGFGFCVIGAFLMAVNYLAAVIWMPHVTAWQASTGRLVESYIEVGWWLTGLAVVASCVGIVLMVRGER